MQSMIKSCALPVICLLITENTLNLIGSITEEYEVLVPKVKGKPSPYAQYILRA